MVKTLFLPVVVGHAYNPRILEAEAGRLQVQGQLGVHNKTLSQKTENKTKGQPSQL
jgi:hypothetical protein